MDEIQEQQELAKEIADAVSNPVGFGHDLDEDELLRELEALQEEDLQHALLDVSGSDINSLPATGLPSAPQHELVRDKKGWCLVDAAVPFHVGVGVFVADRKEEDDLADLEAWAS